MWQGFAYVTVYLIIDDVFRPHFLRPFQKLRRGVSNRDYSVVQFTKIFDWLESGDVISKKKFAQTKRANARNLDTGRFSNFCTLIMRKISDG